MRTFWRLLGFLRPYRRQLIFSLGLAWLAARDRDVMRGPVNFSTNDDCGTLIEGFDTPPTIMITTASRHRLAIM